MPVARSTKETFEYITIADRELPKERQTRFRLRMIDTTTHLLLADVRGEDGNSQFGRWVVIALAVGLAGWENFNDASGAAVPFNREPGKVTMFGLTLEGIATKETLNALSPDDAQELAMAIVRGNTLTVPDAGN